MMKAVMTPSPLLAPRFARFLMDLSQVHGVWIVGGWVRDYHLGLAPHDADFTTSAPASCVHDLAKQHRLTLLWDKVAQDHGIYRFHLPDSKQTLDLATLRQDVAKRGSRHAQVTFTQDIEQDLIRRDLTINGMAYPYPIPLKATPIDPSGGQTDMAQRRLRLIGEPAHRLQEDPLRLLRVLRFACLGNDWHIDAPTLSALTKAQASLSDVSKERMQQELWRSLAMPAPWRFWQLLVDTGAYRAVLGPQIQGGYEAFARAVLWLQKACEKTADPSTRLLIVLTGLCLDCDSDVARGQQVLACMQYLKFSRVLCQSTAAAAAAVPHHPEHLVGPILARYLIGIGEAMRSKVALLTAIAAQHDKGGSPKWSALQARINAMLAGGPIPSLKDLAVTGTDLMEAKLVSPGPDLGHMLQKLLIYGLQEHKWQNRTALLDQAHRLNRASTRPG
jgi:tRNA nucleotidyltransferase (CCA-adding enzyme)